MNSSEPDSAPIASFVIPTRNRKDCLLRCIESAFAQTVPVEVLVYDDGSTDGTPDAVASAFPPDKFPRLTYIKLAGDNGPCVLRNHGTLMARSEFVFAVDDDSILSSPDIVENVLREFDDPRVGVVAIPMINMPKFPLEVQRAPGTDGPYVMGEYIGAAHALRRSPFLAVGGYREIIFQYGEEGDVALRLLDAGYVVRCGQTQPIHHFESPNRNFARWHRLGPRNNIYCTFCNAPLLKLPIFLAGTTVKSILHGRRVGALKSTLQGLLQGYGLILGNWRDRRPVSLNAFNLFRKLRRTTSIKLSDLQLQLPPRRTYPLVPRPATLDTSNLRQYRP